MKYKAGQPLTGVVQDLGSQIYEGFELEKVLIAVRHPQTGEIAQFEGNRETPESRPGCGYAMISQPVSDCGVQIGQIELHSVSASLKAVHLMRIAQSLQDEILDARHLAQAA